MTSRWLVGFLALGSLAALVILVRDTTLALGFWLAMVVVTVSSAMLVRAAQRSGGRIEPFSDDRASEHCTGGTASAPQTPTPMTPGSTPDPDRTAPPTHEPGVPTPVPIDIPGSHPIVITSDEAAALLRVDNDEIIGAIRDGHLPGNRIGDHWRLRTQAVLTWLDGSYTPPRKPQARPRRSPRQEPRG